MITAFYSYGAYVYSFGFTLFDPIVYALMAFTFIGVFCIFSGARRLKRFFDYLGVQEKQAYDESLAEKRP
jgi:hypothetical protein